MMEQEISRLNERLKKILSDRVIYQCYVCRKVTGPEYECCLEDCYSLRKEGYQTLSGYVQTNVRCKDCFEDEKNVCKSCDKLYCCDDERKYIASCYYCDDIFCKEHMDKMDGYRWYCKEHIQYFIPSNLYD